MKSSDQHQDIPEIVDRISRELKQEAFLIVFGGALYALFLAPLMLHGETNLIAAFIVRFWLIILGIFEYVVAMEFALLKRWTYPVVRFILVYVRGFNQNKWVDYRKAINGPIVRKAFGIHPYRLE